MVATVVGEVGSLTVATAIQATAHLRGAARENAAHSPVVVGVKVRGIGTGVARPMLVQQICERERHEMERMAFGSAVFVR